MTRFEITGTATDRWTLEQIQVALGKAGARRIRKRRAFGWSNQPHVATFAAESEAQARKVCNAARELLDKGPGPSLLPYAYNGEETAQ